MFTIERLCNNNNNKHNNKIIIIIITNIIIKIIKIITIRRIIIICHSYVFHTLTCILKKAWACPPNSASNWRRGSDTWTCVLDNNNKKELKKIERFVSYITMALARLAAATTAIYNMRSAL